MGGETVRKIQKVGPVSAGVVIPIEYARYHKLDYGASVRVLYGSFLLIVPPDCEQVFHEREELIRKVLE